MTEFSGKPPGPAEQGVPEPFRVMVVDDSAVIRGLISRALETDPEIKVIASVANGQMAINTLQRQILDVIVLDIEMPVLDGLSALPHLLQVDPNVKVVMASTLTAKGADVSLRALRAGAADYVPKPSSTRELTGADNFKRELTEKVKAWGAAARRADPKKAASAAAPARPASVTAPVQPSTGFTLPTPVRVKPEPQPIQLRPMPLDLRPDLIAIGSSTGGPQALFEVMSHLKDLPQPILITQHMPATFTTILAEHITRQCGVPTTEAKDGEPIVGRHAYVAPGDFHMLVNQKAPGMNMIALSKDAPENFCRPAVDPMLRSIVKAYGRRVLVCILTGMGHDGQKGSDQVVQSGGAVVGQDEASSVVWGMPGAVATAGLCSAVLPLKEIGPFLRKIALRQAA
ncbi:protein-glutamate methylesterase/protein-glutamine glutaminase [Oleisolibacter albus]|uniref:protein-glutamate methylesterase/protein-glutamine glutaminase n=1 Tax=Oleisolibacter albus TaxID=2171757 RepID=UPI000DF4B6AE|nr:chemotaxis response regulator protein-glutamate methylesterase [Oleisolibacter albus]